MSSPLMAWPHTAVRLLLAWIVVVPAAAQDLKQLSIEELMTIDVTSANRREEPLGTAATAISVITGDDIRRSGATTIADALQLADGVHVARFNAGSWAITARGFNQNTANKLLVMVDGRTEYSPLFAGVFWNTLDYVLEDIDRIEVIRGPGAVLWGANAVNGVINIITRSAHATRGGYASVSAGAEDRGLVEARYGGTLGGGRAWRVYGKFADRQAQALATGASATDGRRRGQAGFRLDGGEQAATQWLLKGDAFHSRDEVPSRSDGEFTTLALQARVSRQLAPSSRLTVQSYYRREYRRVPLQLTHHIDTVDVDAQHAWLRGRHDVVWGGGARVNVDRSYGSPVFGFDPIARTYNVSNVFAQDEYALVPGRAYATLGVKVEHNSFSGAAVQPNVRGRVRVGARQWVWGAVSRAIRRPTRFEDDLYISGPGGVPLFRGNDDFQPESLVATEAGYRVQPARSVSLDVTLFRHDVTRLRSQDAPPVGAFPITIGNSLRGRSFGVETAVNLQPADWWRSHVSYTWLDTDVTQTPGSRDIGGGTSEANDPSHLFSARTTVDLPRHVAVTALLRAIGSLPSPAVPAYAELGLRLGWHPHPRTELFITGQDLLHDQHWEFGAAATRVELQRAWRAGLSVWF